jgi:isopentenyldiphosphate isomerase
VQDEYFDVLDDQGNPTGEQKLRAHVHRDGDWHRSFHLWIIREGHLIIFQRRAKTKDLEGGKIDVTVGGHYRTGETLADVVREVEEEIGLRVAPSQLTYLDTRKVTRRYPDAIDNEFQETYLLTNDQPLDHYYLDCAEVTTLYEVPLANAIDLYANGNFTAAYGFDCQQRTNNALLVTDDLIEQARADVVQTLQKIAGGLKQS